MASELTFAQAALASRLGWHGSEAARCQVPGAGETPLDCPPREKSRVGLSDSELGTDLLRVSSMLRRTEASQAVDQAAATWSTGALQHRQSRQRCDERQYRSVTSVRRAPGGLQPTALRRARSLYARREISCDHEVIVRSSKLVVASRERAQPASVQVPGENRSACEAWPNCTSEHVASALFSLHRSTASRARRL